MGTQVVSPLIVPAGSAAAPSLKFGNGAVGFFRTGTSIGITSKGVEVGRLTSTGVFTVASLSATGSFTGLSGTAVPATAGAVAAGVPISMYSSGITIEVTSNTPTHNRAKGSLCINTGGSSTSTRMYVNTDGAGTWTSFTTAA